MVAREAHNLKVTGSNPVPARKKLLFFKHFVKRQFTNKKGKKDAIREPKGNNLIFFL